MKVIEFQADTENIKQRIDKFLLEKLASESISRSFLQQLIINEKVLVDGQSIKKNYCLRGHEKIEIEIDWDVKGDHFQMEAEDIKLDIIYEDEYLIVVNKPVGMVVHPAPGNKSGTLVNALLHHSQQLSGCNSVLRPGIVHRLDKDTCGLLVVAKDDKTHYILAEALKRREIKREYLALVAGEIYEGGEVEAPIGRSAKNRVKMVVVSRGKPAQTLFKPETILSGATLLKVELKTGRTHQIRVHMAHVHHPVLGDSVYGNEALIRQAAGERQHNKVLAVHRSLQFQALQAVCLRFLHPVTKVSCHFSVPVAAHIQKAVEALSREEALYS